MTATKKPKQDDPEQAKRFMEAAKDVGAGKSAASFDVAFKGAVRPEMLTPEEVAKLRREAKENSEYFAKAFAHLSPVKQEK